MERENKVDEEEKLINDNVSLLTTNYTSSKYVPMKWYDSWANLNYGYILLIVVFMVGSLRSVGDHSPEHSLFILFFSTSVDQKVRKMKGTLWRTLYFYLFLLFTGFLGYVNKFPIGRVLAKRSPYERFDSLRSLLFQCSLFILNVMWLFNCVHYDLSGIAFLSDPLRFLFKISYIWLDLLWSLSLLFCTRNTIFQYILQAPFTASIETHKKIGVWAFSITGAHICIALLRWYFDSKEGGIHHVLHNILMYSNPYTSNTEFVKSTRILLLCLPCLLLFFITSHRTIRNRFYEFFYASHRLFSLFFIVLFFFHSPRFHLIIRLPMSLYIIDLTMRLFSLLTRSARIHRIDRFDDVIVMDISLRDRFITRRPIGRLIGAVVYLNIPSISYFQFHPLSVAYSLNSHLYFFIKQVGSKKSWTHQLGNGLRTDYRIRVEGPICMEHHREVGDQGIPMVFSTMNLLKEATPMANESYSTRVANTYGRNVLFVSGGVGLAGIASYVLDLLHALERSDSEQRVDVNIICVMAEVEHIRAMRTVLARWQQSSLCSLHLFCTYRNHPEVRASLPSITNGCELPPNDNELELDDGEDAEVSLILRRMPLRYSTGRPNLMNILQGIPYQALNVFFCGPESLKQDLRKVLFEQNRDFSFHSESFDSHVF